jgi:hypothetical protein
MIPTFNHKLCESFWQICLVLLIGEHQTKYTLSSYPFNSI